MLFMNVSLSLPCDMCDSHQVIPHITQISHARRTSLHVTSQVRSLTEALKKADAERQEALHQANIRPPPEALNGIRSELESTQAALAQARRTIKVIHFCILITLLRGQSRPLSSVSYHISANDWLENNRTRTTFQGEGAAIVAWLQQVLLTSTTWGTKQQ
jgi:hypothetical protein